MGQHDYYPCLHSKYSSSVSNYVELWMCDIFGLFLALFPSWAFVLEISVNPAELLCKFS